MKLPKIYGLFYGWPWLAVWYERNARNCKGRVWQGACVRKQWLHLDGTPACSAAGLPAEFVFGRCLCVRGNHLSVMGTWIRPTGEILAQLALS